MRLQFKLDENLPRRVESALRGLAGSHKGIWALRPDEQTFDAVLHLVLAGVKLAATERTAGQLWVIDERRVRIRE